MRICCSSMIILWLQLSGIEVAAQEYEIRLDTLYLERALVLSKGDIQIPYSVIEWEGCVNDDVSDFISRNCTSLSNKGGLNRWYIVNDRIRFHAHLLSNEIRVRINSKSVNLNEYDRSCDIYYKVIENVTLVYFEITIANFSRMVQDGPSFKDWDSNISTLKFAQIIDYSEVR